MKSKIAAGMVGSAMFALIVASIFSILQIGSSFKVNPVIFSIACVLVWSLAMTMAINSPTTRKAWYRLMICCGVASLLASVIATYCSQWIQWQLDDAKSVYPGYSLSADYPLLFSFGLIGTLIATFGVWLSIIFFLMAFRSGRKKPVGAGTNIDS